MSESDALDQAAWQPRTAKRNQLLSHYGITVPQNGISTNQLKKLEPLDIGKSCILSLDSDDFNCDLAVATVLKELDLCGLIKKDNALVSGNYNDFTIRNSND